MPTPSRFPSGQDRELPPGQDRVLPPDHDRVLPPDHDRVLPPGQDRRFPRGQDPVPGRSRAGTVLRRLGRVVLDAVVEVAGLLLPVTCLGCGAPDRAVCRGCRAALREHPGIVRLVAGVRLDAAFVYGGLVRVLVLELKLRGRVDVAGVLGRPTGVLVRRALAAHPGAVVLRVPPSPSGARRRGFDPVVLLLARGGVRGTGRLRRVRMRARERRGQKERSAVERVTATVGSLRAVGVAGRDVVVVDDVVTTGVTLAESIRAVRAAGGRVVRCVATASVEDGTEPRVPVVPARMDTG